MWRWWILANVLGFMFAPGLAIATRVGWGWSDFVAGAIFAAIQCVVLVRYSLRVLWLIPITTLLWKPLSIVFVYLRWRYGLDATWDLVIPYVDNNIPTLWVVLLGVLQWMVLRYAFQVTKETFPVIVIAWSVAQFILVVAPLFFSAFSFVIGPVLAGLAYALPTAYVLDAHTFRRMQTSEA